MPANTQTTMALAGCLVEAVRKDEADEGCDISAGMIGKHTANLLRDIAFHLDNDCSLHSIQTIIDAHKFKEVS